MDKHSALEPDTIASRTSHSPFVAADDGTPLYCKDWGAGQPVLFISGWSANADMWQYQMIPMIAAGFRCVAYDRRGHGRSGQPSSGYDCDTLADDLSAVIEERDLRGATLVGHSMAAGEIVRYLSRHGAGRVARIVLIAPTTPFILQTPDNPDGVPNAAFEQVRALLAADFPKWLDDNSAPFFVPETSPAMRAWVLGLSLQCSLVAALGCNHAFCETDFRPELPKISVPTLVIHGDKDASTPLELTGRRTAKLIPGAQLKVYEGAPHGLMFTHMDRLTRDLIAFARS
ncbi:MAG: alpha/beta fold hydrolase [Candidatus Binataceae bacterium]